MAVFREPTQITGAAVGASIRSTISSSRILAVAIGLLIAQIALFITISRNRIIDGDEGIYLLAARLVNEHKVPYTDFFYQQMPALPFVYGQWMKVIGTSWYSARALSAVLSAVLGTALFAAVWREVRKPFPAIFALLLYISHAGVLGWFVTVKTYALTALLLFATHQFATSRSSSRSVLAGGLALGLATDVRLYCAALLPLFLIWLYRMRSSWMYFGFGFLLAVLPNLYFVAVSPSAFYFDILGYHAIRTGHAGFVQNWPQKLQILADWASDFQIASLFLVAGLFVFLYRAGGAAARLALFLSLTFAFVCLLPTPTYAQYVCPTLPLLIFAAVVPVSDAIDRFPNAKSRKIVAITFILLLGVSSQVWWRYYPQYFRGVAGMSVANWRVPQAIEISHAVNKFARPGEPVISTWSGYVFETLAEPFPGMENDSRLASAESLDQSQLKDYKLASEQQIASAINDGTIRVAIFAHQAAPPGTTPEEAYYGLLTKRFEMVRRIGDTEIFVRLHGPGLSSGGPLVQEQRSNATDVAATLGNFNKADSRSGAKP